MQAVNDPLVAYAILNSVAPAYFKTRYPFNQLTEDKVKRLTDTLKVANPIPLGESARDTGSMGPPHNGVEWGYT